jgi:ribonuclease BN (tRNA processing enzyme)
MKLTVVGCSPAWPNPGGVQSGYLVESAGRGKLLLDCGGGVLARLRLSAHWPELDAIAITHFHHDHCGDLFPWAVGAIYGPGAGLVRPELIVPAGGRERLTDLAQTLGHVPDLFGRAFRLREFERDDPTEAAGFELRPVPVPHYDTEAFAFRVGDGTRTLAYSGDSGPSPRLAEAAHGCDLFVCEATLTEAEPPPRGHLTLDEARTAFAASAARRLLVTHRPYERPTDDDLEAAYEGLEIVV